MILNVKPTATEEDIKRSYRVLAKKYHPDVNPGDDTAAERFAEVNGVLSDPQKRAEYDAKLKESAAPHPTPEDIIARQRAQAQAAARQAAMRNNNAQATARRGAAYANAGRGNPLNSAAARAQAAARQAAMRNTIRAQAQAQAQAQAAQAAQAAQTAQAQINAIKNQAYQSGYDQGVADTKSAAEKEISRLNTNIRTLTAENKRIKGELGDMERDRSDLEQELFNRDRELSQEQVKTKDLEEQIKTLKLQATESASAASARAKSDLEKMRELLENAQSRIKQLEQEKSQAEVKANAQIQLQQEKRKQLQTRVEELSKQNIELRNEIESVKSENSQWQQYAKSEQFLSDAERRLEDWDKKQKADKKLAKPTLYGALGVLIWATMVEIDAAYAKLVKRYSDKTDEASATKLKKVKDAYAVLSDPKKRTEYNNSIGITEERIETERQLIIDTENIKEEYRDRLESKEFWARFDELTFSAQTGDAESQNALGEMYYFGDEIEQDFEQAVYWFKEAAKQKHAEAMYNLGVCFVNGEGVEKNKTTGLGFIRQAAKLGSKAAKQYGIK